MKLAFLLPSNIQFLALFFWKVYWLFLIVTWINMIFFSDLVLQHQRLKPRKSPPIWKPKIWYWKHKYWPVDVAKVHSKMDSRAAFDWSSHLKRPNKLPAKWSTKHWSPNKPVPADAFATKSWSPNANSHDENSTWPSWWKEPSMWVSNGRF